MRVVRILDGPGVFLRIFVVILGACSVKTNLVETDVRSLLTEALTADVHL